ncbi:MAG: serine/threonine-protein kinase [Planctomycetota bacterium]
MSEGAPLPGSDSAQGEKGDPLIGEEIGGYRIERKLGQGAMGTVYLARQLSLDRPVALKILDERFSRDSVYVERFEREALACARFVHFNVVQVYDFGHRERLYYIVSEYVDGATVQDLINKNGALSPERATEIVLQSACAIAAAQEADIIHRDVKPDNIMIARDGIVKVADFGLAKLTQEGASVTQTGVIGTPFYMSPEQAQGGTADSRSDIYSLGVTFFHMLTGQVPFIGENVLSVLLQHVSGERPDPTAINPAVPRIVSDVVLRMMAREPARRYAAPQELVRALEELLARLKRGETDEETSAWAALAGRVDPERLKGYKFLRADCVSRLFRREMDPEKLDRLLAHAPDDSGVYVEAEKPFPEKSVLQIRFSIAGRPDEVEALGLVRWRVTEGPLPGMAVTFLQVKSVPPPGPQVSSTAVASRVEMSVKEAMQHLTLTARHMRMLKYYCANAGRTVTLQQIAGSLGMGTRIVKQGLQPLKELGLAVDKGGHGVAFLWPDDPSLQTAMLDWIEKHGLR